MCVASHPFRESPLASFNEVKIDTPQHSPSVALILTVLQHHLNPAKPSHSLGSKISVTVNNEESKYLYELQRTVGIGKGMPRCLGWCEQMKLNSRTGN